MVRRIDLTVVGRAGAARTKIQDTREGYCAEGMGYDEGGGVR